MVFEEKKDITPSTYYCLYRLLYFSDAPEIVFSSPDNLKAVEGSGTEIFCNATGNPKPNITWTKRGNSTVLSTSENLKLTKLKREESGAVFNCIVQNHHGSSETSVTISVLCGYRFYELSFRRILRYFKSSVGNIVCSS